ncbi:MAG: hypothetical protein M9965_15945 [Anaerolineae bacterium]|nr:hypothetical protein [Anaerolineae bacterium]
MKSIAQPAKGVNTPQADAIQRDSLPVADPSASLLAANERLLSLRAQVRHRQSAVGRHLDTPLSRAKDSKLPAHLGWDSARMTAILRRSSGGNLQGAIRSESKKLRIVIKQSFPPPTTIKAYPTLLNAILKNEQVAVGRVWLLCRYLDRDGRGWIAMDAIQRAFVKKEAHHKGRVKGQSDPLSVALFGRRRLRQILGQGKSVFWDRDDQGRLWIFGAARVAANLGIARLQNRAVMLPLAGLTGSIGQARALFYAAFHAGRPAGQPVSRAAIEQVTGVPARTQAHYEQQAGIGRKRNFTIGAGWGSDSAENDAYAHGNAVFHFVDHRGRHGKCGQHYAARQLPNSYTTKLQTCARGRQRKINTRLADLVTRGAGERPETDFARLYYRDGQAAAQALTRTNILKRRLFWKRPEEAAQDYVVWHEVL